MSETQHWILIAIGLVAIAVLILVIRHHSGILVADRRAQEQARKAAEDRRQHMIQSIRVLAMTIEQDQVEYSEACIRIKGLLDEVEPELLEKEPFKVFKIVSDGTQHMPTHEARLQTNRKFIRKLDQERFALEDKHHHSIREAASAIRYYPFEPEA
ncbi:DUF2489 domain-containing protein [Marinobacteraceae bacterium S3BR75-40.1]